MLSTPNSSPVNKRNCAPVVSTPCRTMLRRPQKSDRPFQTFGKCGLTVPQASSIPSHIGLSSVWYVFSSIHKPTRQGFTISPTSFGHNFSKMIFSRLDDLLSNSLILLLKVTFRILKEKNLRQVSRYLCLDKLHLHLIFIM